MSVQSLIKAASAATLLSLSHRARVEPHFCKIKLYIPCFVRKFEQLHTNQTPF